MISTGSSDPSLYPPLPPGGWQEHLDLSGGITPAWKPFLDRLSSTTPAERQRVQESISRELREDGLTFTLSRHGDAVSAHRERVDPVPWIFEGNQWAHVEKGVAQRCRLLEAVVQDLMGPRTLLSRGVLPAGLVFADPAYLRSCVGLPSRMGAHLFQAGVDLARGPDGKFWVLEDRTQAPSGAGFALESRTILGGIFPGMLSEMSVRRLAAYFRMFRESLLSMYEGRRLEPRVVLLSPGPYSPLYFEHAYLASYLGYTLVQGSDLLVRNGAVRLKTLEGLQPVDIVYRYVDASYLDPLELRRDSFLGVPGLLGAVRAGRVSLLNHPGCGLLENSGFMAFYPLLCRKLLGEELILPSVATWWCGQPKERAYVLNNLSKLIIKPLQRSWNQPPKDGSLCSKDELRVLREKILANPEGYVGQERVEFSRLPTMARDEMEIRPGRFRAFASASPHGYQVMPGALARVVPPGGGMDVAGQGMMKDVWVLGQNPEPHQSLWLDHEVVQASKRFTGVFTSRSAENLFWVGRYAERITRQARLLRGMAQTEMLQPENEHQTSGELRKMLDLMELYGAVEEADESDESDEVEEDSHEERLERAVCGDASTGSLVSNLRSMVSAAYTVRDIWSQDTWRTLVSMEALGRRFEDADPARLATLPVVDDLLEKLNAFYGLNTTYMTRESGWSMLMLGRNLEAAIGLCDSVAILLGPSNHEEDPIGMMELLLQQNENLITYRRHYRTTPRMESVLELVTASEQNPGSLVYYLERAPKHMNRLPPPSEPAPVNDILLRLKQFRARLLVENGLHTNAKGEFPVLAEVRELLQETSTVISSAYFSHTALMAREEY